MPRLLLAAAIVAAGFATTTPASATHCDVEYKKYCVSVCLTTDVVYHAVTGEHLACA